MKRAALVLLLLLVSGIASAGTAFVGAPNSTAKFAAFYKYRKIRICAIPDTQNQMGASGNISAYWPDSNACSFTPGVGAASANCREPYCTTPKWCGSPDWYHTGQVTYRNQYRILTGNYAAVDWENITGGDTRPRNHWENSHGMMACDAIVSLGDIMSFADDPNSYTTASLTYDQNRTYQNAIEFWKAIADSNIPAIMIRGNHDPLQVTASLWVASGMSAKSYVLAREATRGVASSVLVPMTNAGKPLCIVSTDSLLAAADPQNGTETAFTINQSGCGGGYPTILVGHEITAPISSTDCDTQAVGDSILFDSHSAPTFLVLGGHYLSQPPSCAEKVLAGTEASNFADYIHVFLNEQEFATHYYNGSTFDTYPYGNAPASGGGGTFLNIIVDPRYSTVTVQPWSPYFETDGDPSAVDPTAFAIAPAALFPTRTFSFNFDARFP